MVLGPIMSESEASSNSVQFWGDLLTIGSGWKFGIVSYSYTFTSEFCL